MSFACINDGEFCKEVWADYIAKREKNKNEFRNED
jgi:hypothetical protein